MIIGLELFKEHFANHVDQYVLIGGLACTLVMEDVGLAFRATKDFDIVLYIEAIDGKFIAIFNEFLKKGGYQNKRRSSGKEIFYRFDSPHDPHYPSILELFSRRTDVASLSRDGLIQRIKMSESAMSLSSILLNDDYYRFIHEGKIVIEGLSVVNASHLIPLKARAWIDLTDKQNQGMILDSKDIRKHKNDILRLYQLLAPENRIFLPDPIKSDMQHFVKSLKKDSSLDIKQLGLKNTNLDQIITNFKEIYHLA